MLKLNAHRNVNLQNRYPNITGINQSQLEYCDLDECDFLQVKIVEYDSFEDYKKDVMLTIDDSIQCGYSGHARHKGRL